MTTGQIGMILSLATFPFPLLCSCLTDRVEQIFASNNNHLSTIGRNDRRIQQGTKIFYSRMPWIGSLELLY